MNQFGGDHTDAPRCNLTMRDETDVAYAPQLIANVSRLDSLELHRLTIKRSLQ